MSLDMSLCILTHNRVPETQAMIESIRRFKDLKIEISIADQGSRAEDKQWFKDTADRFTEVSDRDLWDYGLGNAKQASVENATNDWIIIGDPSELWHENIIQWPGGLVGAIEELHGNVPALRVLRGAPGLIRDIASGEASPELVSDDNGRVFRRSIMKIVGYMHEAPMQKATGELWAYWARQYPCIAWVEHDDEHNDAKDYATRKQVLYFHLIHKIVMQPDLRIGTDYHWWTRYWQDVVEPNYKEVSFEEWQKIGG